MKTWQKALLWIAGAGAAGTGVYFIVEALKPKPTPGPAPAPGQLPAPGPAPAPYAPANVPVAPAAPKPAAVTTGSHVIVPGVTIRAVQDALNQNGYSLATDNLWGPKTEAATRDFQGKHGLAVDGIVGPQTWGALQAGRAAGPALV